jgi:uncharacterized protein (DUF952 family)
MNEKTTRIVHLCSANAWHEAIQQGQYTAASLTKEGFIHFSRSDQILKVANQFYRTQPNLVLLWINPASLIAELRWEAVDDDVFPHLYGPLNLDAVLAVTPFSADSDGFFYSVPTPKI